MSLDATALVTLAEAKAFIIVTGEADNAALEAAINAASGACESYCNRGFRERIVTERVEGPMSQRLYLNAVPLKVSAAVSVTVDDTAQTVWKQEIDGLQSAFDVIARPDHLYRRSGWTSVCAWPSGWVTGLDPYNVLLSYTGGYTPATMPGPVKEACLYIAQKLFRDSRRQLAEVASVNTPMGGISILDNAMPRVARMLLDPYRYVVVA